jgi:hypothetical protein
MERKFINGSIQYRINVGNTWYITTKPLSDFKAEGIRGRATRVWEAYMEMIQLRYMPSKMYG